MTESVPKSKMEKEARNIAMLAELHDVVTSPRFRRSPVMADLLTYLIEREASDNPEPPKAYEIAVDALGRDEDFDVQSDSYPRVQIGRLRSMLREYYTKRKLEPVLQIPLGNYSVEYLGNFQPSSERRANIVPAAVQKSPAEPNHEDADSAVGKAAITPGALAAAIAKSPIASANTRIGLWIVLMLSISFYGLTNASRSIASDPANSYTDPEVTAAALTKPPKLYVEVETLFDDPDDKQKRALAFNLRNHLENFESLAIGVSIPAKTARTERDQYKLKLVYTDMVNSDGDNVARMSLIAMGLREVIWSEKIALPQDKQSRRKTLGKSIARVAGKYGVIASSQRKRIQNDELSGYNCLLEFDAYRAVSSPKKLRKIEACVADSLKKNPYNPRLLAAAAYLAYPDSSAVHARAEIKQAQRFASRALLADRNSSSANFAIARSAFLAKNCLRGKKYADRAIKLSPDEPDYIARTGLHLLACDTMTAEDYARRAITFDATSSAVPYFTLVYANISQDDPEEAIRAAKQILPGTPNVLTSHYNLTMAIAYAAGGKKIAAKRHWEKAQTKFSDDGSNNVREIIENITGNPMLAKKAIRLMERSGIKVGLV